jgi:non-specific serine/threonine protein kinase
MDAFLDFDVGLTLDGKKLSKREIKELLSDGDGLVLIKRKWVEVERDKLAQVIDHWRDVQQQARTGGFSFGEAMRMLSGTRLYFVMEGDQESLRGPDRLARGTAQRIYLQGRDGDRNPQRPGPVSIAAGDYAQLFVPRLSHHVQTCFDSFEMFPACNKLPSTNGPFPQIWRQSR